MEFDLIDIIRARTSIAREDVVCGIGDDAALLTPPPGHELAVAIDTMVEGVHFLTGTAPADIGWKALAVNLSDLAAMGATPAWAVLSLTLPRAERAFVEGFADGFAQLAQRYQLALVGGDTTCGPLSVSVAVHGFVPAGQGLLRGTAQTGDLLFVTGTLGDAAAALHCHLDRDGAAVPSALHTRMVRPEPRVAAGQALRGLAHAAIDISDGLLADLAHVCTASGTGARIEAARMPCSPALVARFGVDGARAYALSGGDDYELCFSVPAERADAAVAALERVGCPATRIGSMVESVGIRVCDERGHDVTPQRRGWEHFAS